MNDRGTFLINKMNDNYIRNRRNMISKLSVEDLRAAKIVKDYYKRLEITVLKNKHAATDYAKYIGSICNKTNPCLHSELYCKNYDKDIGYCVPQKPVF